MLFGLEGFSFLNVFTNIKEKIFCKKRKRQETDPNLNYIIKKRSQTSHYFEDYSKTQSENYEFTNSQPRKSFQKVVTIRYTPKRRSHSLDKNLCLSSKHSNLKEDKSNFNDQIIKTPNETINRENVEIKEETKSEREEKTTVNKKTFKFRTKMLKLQEKPIEVTSIIPINSKTYQIKDVNDFNSFNEYTINKNPRNYPKVDQLTFKSLQE